MNYADAAMTANLQAAAEQAARAVQLARMVRAGKLPMDSLSTATRQAVEFYLATQAPNSRQFFAKQNADLRQHLLAMKKAGHVFHSISQEASDTLLQTILDTVDAGGKPDVPGMLRAYASEHQLPTGWADSVVKKVYPKKVRKSLAKHRGHRVITELREAGQMSNTHQAALRNSSFPGMGELFFGSSKMVRKQAELEARLAAAEAKLAETRAEADRANARLDLLDSGKDWKETARTILAVEPKVSNRKLAARVGVGESTVRKYRAELA